MFIYCAICCTCVCICINAGARHLLYVHVFVFVSMRDEAQFVFVFVSMCLYLYQCVCICTCVCICINAGRGTIGNKFWIMAQPSLHQGQHRPIVLLRQEADDDDNAFACLLFFISKPQLKLILISHLFIGHNLWILWSICLIPVGFAVPQTFPGNLKEIPHGSRMTSS